MATDFIEVSAGGPPPEQDIPDGTYPVILTDIKEPRTVHVQNGQRAGQDMELRDWLFRINATGHALDGRELEGSTSTASGPKSKQFGFLTAFNNGQPPAVGQRFTKDDLVGRMVLAQVYHDGGGYPKVGSLTAMPVGMQQAAFASAVQPAAATAPIAEQVAAPAPAPAPADNLPF